MALAGVDSHIQHEFAEAKQSMATMTHTTTCDFVRDTMKLENTNKWGIWQKRQKNVRALAQGRDERGTWGSHFVYTWESCPASPPLPRLGSTSWQGTHSDLKEDASMIGCKHGRWMHWGLAIILLWPWVVLFSFHASLWKCAQMVNTLNGHTGRKFMI